MSGQEPVVLIILKFFIPDFFSMLFRVYGLGAKSRYRAVMGMMMFVAYMIIVPFGLFHIMSYSEYQKLVFFIMFAGNMFVFYISSDGFFKTAFLHSCQANAVMVVSILCNGLRHVLHLGYLELCVMEFVICLVGFIFAVRYVAKSFRYIADHIHANWILMLIIPMAMVISCIVVVTYFDTYFGEQPIRNMLVVLMQEFIFFLYLWILYKNFKRLEYYSEQEKQQELLSMATRNMSERLSIMEENAKQSRRVTHDRRHFNNMLLELIEAGEVNEAKELLQKQNAQKIEPVKKYCDYPLLNAAIGFYDDMARKEGIEMKLQLELGKELLVDELELSLALSNLLENAVHACKKQPEDQVRFIHMKCLDKGRLMVEVINSCIGEIHLDAEGYPVTAESGHGIGTKSVRAFVEKQNGEILYKIESGRFQVRVLM